MKKLYFKTKYLARTAFLGLYPEIKVYCKIYQKFLNQKNEFLFTGLIKAQNNYYNSAILINSKAEIRNIYNKNILSFW